MRRAIKWLGFSVAALFLTVAALFGYREYQEWTAQRLIAEAEALNQTEWESGTATRLIYSLAVEFNGVTETLEKTVTCYRKQEFDVEFSRPVRRLVYKAYGFVPGFRHHHSDRSYHIKPDEALCALGFEPSTPQALPIAISATVGISSLLEDEAPDDDSVWSAMRQLERRCRVVWPGDRPVTFGQSLTLHSLRLTAIESLPVRDAIKSAQWMGHARGDPSKDFLRASEHFFTAWNQEKGCWIPNRGEHCGGEAAWDCGSVHF